MAQAYNRRIKNNPTSPRKYGKIIISTIALTVLLTSGYWLTVTVIYHPYFAVTSVKIAGNNLLSYETAMQQLGIKDTDTLLSLDSSDLVAKLKVLAMVKEVTLKRQFPGTLSFALVEYQPVAWGKFKKKFYLLDRYGCVLEKTRTPTDHKLPILSGFQPALIKQQLRQGLDLLMLLQKDALTDKVTEVVLSDQQNLLLKIKNLSCCINIGSGKAKTAWLSKLKKIMAAKNLPVDLQQIKTIDLRFKRMAVLQTL